MHLRADLDRELTREITEFEEARKMPHMTSVERFGRTSILLSLLAEVCGPLPQDDEDRVFELPATALEKLAKALLRFQSLDDLHDWLDRYASSDV